MLRICDRGYLDVAIVNKIVSETRKKIQNFVSETRKKIQNFVSETRGNWLPEYLVSESWVHQKFD